jgi:hypothetical protein
MEIRDLLFQIALAFLGTAVGVTAPCLRKKYQKIVAAIASLLFIASASAWAGYEIGSRGVVETRPPNTLVNIYQRNDFEQSAGDWKLLICADDPCKGGSSQWYKAPSQPTQGQPGFTGEHSLNIQMELRPDRWQVYSAQYCLAAASLTEVISANIYAPEIGDSFTVFIFGNPSGAASGDPWPSSSLVISKPGWYRLFLDLRNSFDNNGTSFSEQPLACIHIDFVLPKISSQQIVTVPFLIDDVEFFK